MAREFENPADRLQSGITAAREKVPPQPLPPQSLPPQSLPPQSLPPQSLPPQSLPPQSLPSASAAPSLPQMSSVGDGDDQVLEKLLVRMRDGDREAAAEFVMRYGPRIRRRVRARLNPSMRRIFDSEELLSTMARRLDQFVKDGKLTAENQARLWALINRIGDNAVIDRYRLMKRLDEIESPTGKFALRLRSHQADATAAADAVDDPEQTTPLPIADVMQWVIDPRDRQILMLWLHDVPLATIAECMSMNAPAVRKRWQTIRERLRDRLVPPPDRTAHRRSADPSEEHLPDSLDS